MNEMNLKYKDKYLKYKKKYLSLKNEVGGMEIIKKSCHRLKKKNECDNGTGHVGFKTYDCIWMPNYKEGEDKGDCFKRTDEKEKEKIEIEKEEEKRKIRIISKYTSTKPLGEGAFGSVYSIDKNTVVKVIDNKKQELKDEDEKKRLLEKEIDILRNIKYPFATYLKKDEYNKDYFEYKNTHYLIMNKLPGIELFYYLDYLNNNDIQLNEMTKKYLIVQMILFNYYNHINKVIHLDLKPENYYFNEKTNKLYILDYGLAACFNESKLCESKKDEKIGFSDIIDGTPEFKPPSMNDTEDGINTKYLDDYFIISLIIFAELFDSDFKNNIYLKGDIWIEWKKTNGHTANFNYKESKKNNAYELFKHYVMNYRNRYDEHEEIYLNENFDPKTFHRNNVKESLGFFGINKEDINLTKALNYIDQFHNDNFNDDMKTKENKLWNHIKGIAENIQL